MMATKVLVLRPGKAGSELAELLTKDTITAKHAPTLVIQGLPFQWPKASYDCVIFVSPTAVTYSTKQLSMHTFSYHNTIAVGDGTAAELTALGIKDVLVPEQFNSEGLLVMRELTEVAGKRILIIKGRGGRTLLHDTLVSRGAQCDTVDVYSREPQLIDAAIWHWMWEEGDYCRAITSASIESLIAFDEQRIQQQRPFPDFIMVASDRIAEVATGLGYTDVRTVGGAANHYFTTAMENNL